MPKDKTSKTRSPKSRDAAARAAAAPSGVVPADEYLNAEGRTQRRAQRLPPAVPPTRPSRQLHVFDNPAPGRDYLIRFTAPEFTCHCPLTGQPDFAHFTIDMVCDKLCIELKSLKMYFWSYRDEGAFHEKVTNTILDDIVAATDPRFVRITARWFVRGGIHTDVVVEHRRKGWKPAQPVVLPAPSTASTSI